VIRVSSQATISALASTRLARGERSPRFPMGVATTHSPGSSLLRPSPPLGSGLPTEWPPGIAESLMLNPIIRCRTVVALLAAACLSAACVPARQETPTAPPRSAVQTPPPATVSAGPVRVGLLLPLSGQAAEIGNDMLEAAQMALFDVGENELVLLPRDTGDDPGQAAEAARAVVRQGAELILGPLFAGSTRAAAPVAAGSANVLSFSNDAAAAGGNAFVLGFRPDEQVERVTRFALDQGVRRIALLAPEDAYGSLAARAFDRSMQASGSVGTTAFYPPQGEPAEALAGLLTGGSLGNLDAVLIADGGPRLLRVATLLRAPESNGSGLRLLGTSRWLDDLSVLRDPSFYGSWVAGVPPATDQAFERRFEAAFGRTPHELAALAYDATALAVLLARSDRSFDAGTITDPQGFVGSLGAFRIRADGLTDHSLAISEVRPEGLVVIEPAPGSFAPVTPAF
jgi:branched-chain amino acid transport system substrate-binding protein